VVGVWATPNLGFFWRWILAPACKLARGWRLFLCARLFSPLSSCACGSSSLRAPCTRLLLPARALLAARQSCSPLAAAPRLLAAAARWARGWPAAPLPWRPSLVGPLLLPPPLLSLRCQHQKMMFIFPCFHWFGCLLFVNSCL
jgi:hypothetical protein